MTEPASGILKLNILLFAAAALGIIGMVLISNSLVSKNYRVELTNRELRQRTAELAAQQTVSPEHLSISARAVRAGMVSGNEGEVLVVTSGVALTDASAPKQN